MDPLDERRDPSPGTAERVGVTGLAYGLAIDADLPLELPPAGRARDVVIRSIAEPAPDGAIRWFRDDDDSPWTGGLVGDDYLLRFADHTDFVISADGASIEWHCPDPPSTTLIHLVLDHALPYCLMRRGQVVLHASCLVTPAGIGYAIAGPSGFGKSTLAATMLARGHRFLGDDCAAVDIDGAMPLVAPAYPGLRLDQRSTGLIDLSGLREAGPVSDHGHKRRLAMTSPGGWVGDERFPLRSIFILGDTRPQPDGRNLPAPGRLGGSAALLSLLPNSFHIAAEDDRPVVLERMARLAESCPVERIVYQHTPAGLNRTVGQIEATLDGLAPPGP